MYDDVRDWLAGQLQAHGYSGSVHTDLARRDNGWLHIPVYVSGPADAYDKASILQEMEDAWNEQEPQPPFQLLLVPSAN